MADHWTTNDIPDLAGKTALVTGANAGLGYEISKILADHGARVLLACRNADKAQAAATTIQEGNPKGSVEVRQVDLASMGSIDELAGKIIGEESSLDLLINNAGLMAVDEEKTQDGFEMQLGVNHLGQVHSTNASARGIVVVPSKIDVPVMPDNGSDWRSDWLRDVRNQRTRLEITSVTRGIKSD